MYQFRYFLLLLLAGLMPSLGRAASKRAASKRAASNLDIWDLDDSCTNYFDGTTDYNYGKEGGVDQTSYVQESFDIALSIIQAAQDSLNFVLKKRPDPATDKDGFNKWIRIAESMLATLGFFPDPDKEESSGDKYWSSAFAVIDLAVTTLQSDQNSPATGFNKVYPLKPLIICGDNWQWIAEDETIPNYTKKMQDYFKSFIERGGKGAWYKKRRWIFKRVPQEEAKPIICTDSKMIAATSFNYNAIILCDRVFTDDMKAMDTPETTLKDNKITLKSQLWTFSEHVSYSVVHELMHWFGGLTKNAADGSYNLNSPVIIDQQAVDKNGYLVYEKAGKRFTSPQRLDPAKVAAQGFKPAGAYGPRDIWNLARTHPGGLSAFSGPAMALTNADSLARFALMMYYDTWNWAYGAEARPLGTVYSSDLK